MDLKRIEWKKSEETEAEENHRKDKEEAKKQNVRAEKKAEEQNDVAEKKATALQESTLTIIPQILKLQSETNNRAGKQQERMEANEEKEKLIRQK